MRKFLILTAAMLVLGACERKSISDCKPLYCYQSIGAVQCFSTPNHRDEKRLVNYCGPHPDSYEKPAAPTSMILPTR